MEPTTAPGKLRMRRAPQAAKYAPDAPVPRIQATTGLADASRFTATWMASDAVADPPGESMSRSTPRMR